MVDINSCIASSTYLKNTASRIRVMLPKFNKPFRVHPTEFKANLWVYYCRERSDWFLVNTKLAQSGEFECVELANLYLAMYEDGEMFLIPQTIGSNGKGNSYSRSLDEIIDSARKTWMCRTSVDKNNKRHLASVNSRIKTKPEWDLTIDECLMNAFEDKIIKSPKQFKSDIELEFEE